jgi:hypothetical protein
MARKLMSAPRLDDAMGDRTNHLADQLGYVRRRPCLSKQSQGDRRGVDHTDPRSSASGTKIAAVQRVRDDHLCSGGGPAQLMLGSLSLGGKPGLDSIHTKDAVGDTCHGNHNE